MHGQKVTVLFFCPQRGSTQIVPVNALYSGLKFSEMLLVGTSLELIIHMNTLFTSHRNAIAFNANELQFNEFQRSAHFSFANVFRLTIKCLAGHLARLNR